MIARLDPCTFYSVNNRMTGYKDTSTGIVTNYYHNGLGERVAKKVAGQLTLYMYDLSGNLIAEYDKSTRTTTEYIYGASGRLATLSNQIYWHHNDHLGTPQALTDMGGSVVWSMSQTPFGIATVNEDPDGDGITVTNNFRFPGQYYDSETGMNYNYQRTYDPAIGGYTQHDPIGLNGGMNPFGYVGGNPIGYTDPRGLVEWKGSQKTLSASLGGGAIEFLFTLKSECVNGKRGIVKITAGGFVLSVGFPASATYSRSVTFDDGMTSIDPSVFSGAARYEYISYAVGVAGGSYQAIQLGNAHSVGGGFQQGLDSSIGFGQGSSFVTSSKIIDCECK